MAKANKTDGVVNYVKRTATVEEIAEFICKDERPAFSSLKLLGEDFVKSQSRDLLVKMVDNANAWQPDLFDAAKSIIKSFVVEDPQERKSLSDAEIAELASNCCVVKENTKFSYHKASFAFYCPKDGENVSDHANSILQDMAQVFVNLTTYCPSAPYKNKNGKVEVPETSKLPEKNILPPEYLTRLVEFEKQLWEEFETAETEEPVETTETTETTETAETVETVENN
jgi:hypothetical protein